MIEAIPIEARIHRRASQDAPWGMVEELLAQLIEEVSELGQHPKRMTRPYETPQGGQAHTGDTPPATPAVGPGAPQGQYHTPTGGRVANGHDAMLAMFGGASVRAEGATPS